MTNRYNNFLECIENAIDILDHHHMEDESKFLIFGDKTVLVSDVFKQNKNKAMLEEVENERIIRLYRRFHRYLFSYVRNSSRK